MSISYMSAIVIIEFIKQVEEKRSNAWLAERAFYPFFATSLLNSTQDK